MIYCLLINSGNESSTIEDKSLHLYNTFTYYPVMSGSTERIFIEKDYNFMAWLRRYEQNCTRK